MPTFLVIGAAKAGTTALYHYLRVHPDVYMSPIKEAAFFRYTPEQRHPGVPRVLRKGRIRSLAAYQALFEGVTDESAIGEASPAYLHTPVAAENIKHHLPGARLVAILRHPVDRAYSHYMLHMREGRVPYRSFETFFKESLPRLHEWHQMPRDCYGLARSFYYKNLKHYYDLFPRKQIRIYRFVDLKNQPAHLLADLYRFIGVDAAFRPDLSKRYNVGGGIPRNQRLHQMIVGDHTVKVKLKRITPRNWWRRFHGMLLRQTQTRRKKLASDVRDAFFEVYREDVVKTQQLTHVDLSHWLPEKTG